MTALVRRSNLQTTLKRNLFALLIIWTCLPIFAQPYPATLYGFGTQNASKVAGLNPNSTLAETSPGVFYGTAEVGGNLGCGTLFKITSGGVFTKLHDFAPSEGCFPTGRLVQAGDGYLYGTTIGSFVSPGNSVLFRSDLSGNVTTVVLFVSNSYPLQAQAPTLAADGSIYTVVTAFQESTGVDIFPVFSSIYHYGLDGTKGPVGRAFSVGYIPPPLIQANDGNLYGVVSRTTQGVTNVEVFKVTTNGIRSIVSVPDAVQGDAPVSIGQGSDGKLYFTTSSTLASVQLDGKGYTVIGTAGSDTCQIFQTGFLLASDGQLYGGCGGFVPEVNGAIYTLEPNGFFYPFTAVFGGSVQLASQSSLGVEGTDGNFYGETQSIAEPTSPSFSGAIYSLATGLAPPPPAINLLTPFSGPVGSSVTIYGDHLLGVTGVSFDGIPAEFHLAGVNLMTATVPAGVTAAKVSVATPNGTGTSSRKFVVTQ